MKLSVLTGAIKPLRVNPDSGDLAKDPDIGGICYRSDQVSAGDLFVAVQGMHTDGHDFVEDAVIRGAAAVVVEKPVMADAVVVEVTDARRAMALMADVFYGSPSSKLTLIGITGTNGKTTTACLLAHILKENGFKTGVIGTIGCHFGDTIIPGTLTTPEAPDLQERLARMVDAGVSHAIIEVSSHGVVQNRIAGCRFEMGIFTNLSQDHLDFHGDMESYRAAKIRFFTEYLGRGAVSVINCDAEDGRRLAAIMSEAETITVGTVPTDTTSDSPALWDVRGEIRSYDQSGISGRIVLPSGAFDYHCPLVGRFNAENILCAASGAFVLGVRPGAIRQSLASFGAVAGRLEKVAGSASRHVFVDYSHTPDALQNVLGALKPIVAGRLICVFGCGGDRDKGKRPQMGNIAATLADLAIVTSDNPRTEPPEKIIADILAGVRPTGKVEVPASQLDACFDGNMYVVEEDRSKAIQLGIRVSLPGDCVLIAGKGHETYQIIGETTIDFDDRVHAEKALAECDALVKSHDQTLCKKS